MTETDSPGGADAGGPAPRPAALYAFLFLCGFATMGVELTAVRLLAPHFGTSTIVWTNVICVILVALSIGFAVGGAVADRRPGAGTLSGFALMGGVLLLVVPALGPWVATAAVPDELPVEAAHAGLLLSSLAVAAVLFAPPVFFLGATSPLAYKLLLRDMPHVGRRVGFGAMVSTLGGIAGTYVPTLWLVPLVGTRRTLWMMAGVTLAAALLARFGARRSAVAALAALASLPFAAGSPGRVGATAPGSIVEERETRYQYLAVRDDGVGTITLTANEGRFGYQSAYRTGEWLTDGKYFDLFNLFAAAAAPPGAPLRVLVLGFAGGTAAREIHHFFSGDRVVSIDGVEIDPAAVELGRRHLGLELGPADGLRVFHEDARTFVNRARGPYDLVIVDVYAHDVYIPFQVASLEFFRALAGCLAPEGLLVINASMFTPEAEPLRLLENTVATAMGTVGRYPIEFSQNVLLVSSKGRPLDPLRGGDGARETSLPEGLRSLRSAFRADRLVIVGPDPALEPLTDDKSPLEIETEKLLRRLSRSLAEAGR